MAAALLLLGIVLLLAGPKSAARAGESAQLVVAAKDVPAGAPLVATDVRLAAWPVGLVPDGAVRTLNDVIGKPLAGSVSAGEPLTAARLLNTSISSALGPGQVAVSVTLRDANQTAILQAGARIDLYVAQTEATTAGAEAGPVASNVAILAVLPDQKTAQTWTAPTTDVTAGASVAIVIACDRATAAQLAQAAGGQFLASLRP
jgi:Flp pilus assembly protein CpaB